MIIYRLELSLKIFNIHILGKVTRIEVNRNRMFLLS